MLGAFRPLHGHVNARGMHSHPESPRYQRATRKRACEPQIGMALAPLRPFLFNRTPDARGKPENDMASITVNDLSLNLALDRKAMAAIRGGGGAPWVYGWIQPYVRETPSIGPVVNLYDISNNFYANQMINTFQSVDVRNTGANSNINVSPDARSRNDTV
jgi:hypothetical protein